MIIPAIESQKFANASEKTQQTVFFMVMNQLVDRVGGVAKARQLIDDVEQHQEIARALYRADGRIPGGPLDSDAALLKSVQVVGA